MSWAAGLMEATILNLPLLPFFGKVQISLLRDNLPQPGALKYMEIAMSRISSKQGPRNSGNSLPTYLGGIKLQRLMVALWSY